MNYIGNFSTWIDPKIISTILSSKGERRPKTNIEGYEDTTLTQWQNAGYDLSKLGWEFFYNQHINKDHIDLPISTNGRKYKWWFSKLNPGDFFPMHVDHFKTEKNVQRFWMACQDHQMGHVFAYDNSVLQDYRAGDMYEFTDSGMWHAAANLGVVPKISLQIILFD